MDDAVKVHPQRDHCSSFYAYFPFIIGILFMSMSARLLGGFV